MSDVVIGGLLAVVGGLVGGLGGVLVQGHLNQEAERRAEDRARTDRLREFRADSLRTAYRMFVAMGEHVRATRGGESPEQIARLRQQMESTANLGGDPTLFGPDAPAVIQGFSATIQRFMGGAPGSGLTKQDVEEIANWESQLGVLYVKAMQRILADDVSMPAR
jgi:hypothetical protein